MLQNILVFAIFAFLLRFYFLEVQVPLLRHIVLESQVPLLRRSEARIKEFVQDYLIQSERRMKQFVREESHQFSSNSVDKGLVCVKEFPQHTGFAIQYKNLSYFVIPAHLDVSSKLNHEYADVAVVKLEKHDNEQISHVFRVHEGVLAEPRIGDPLFSFGYDAGLTEKNIPRFWSGYIHSIYDEQDKHNPKIFRKFISVGGYTVSGMSGSPVFNGCGLAGVSVGLNMRTSEYGNYFAGAMVVHVKHLLELLNSPKAPDFALADLSYKFCEINVKYYCRNTGDESCKFNFR